MTVFIATTEDVLRDALRLAVSGDEIIVRNMWFRDPIDVSKHRGPIKFERCQFDKSVRLRFPVEAVRAGNAEFGEDK